MLPKIIFIGGKGGVGKSTVSSSISTYLSKSKKVLLISTDPAHNLSDIFGIQFTNNIQNAKDNLYVVEIDPQLEAMEYVKKVAKNARNLIGVQGYSQIDDYFDKIANSSSTIEAALFERLTTLININSDYDHIIIDTAPTGHTLKLFFMPKQLRNWSKNLLSMQERGSMAERALGHLSSDNRFSDPDGFIRGNLIEILDERYARYNAFANILKDPSKCGIVFVLNPNKLAINETKRAIESLSQKGLKPHAIILNKILPHSSNDDFMNCRIDQEKIYIKQSDEYFKDYKYIKLPLMKSDITDIKLLNDFGKLIFQMWL